jgi:hypothetical protein
VVGWWQYFFLALRSVTNRQEAEKGDEDDYREAEVDQVTYPLVGFSYLHIVDGKMFQKSLENYRKGSGRCLNAFLKLSTLKSTKLKQQTSITSTKSRQINSEIFGKHHFL